VPFGASRAASVSTQVCGTPVDVLECTLKTHQIDRRGLKNFTSIKLKISYLLHFYVSHILQARRQRQRSPRTPNRAHPRERWGSFRCILAKTARSVAVSFPAVCPLSWRRWRLGVGTCWPTLCTPCKHTCATGCPNCSCTSTSRNSTSCAAPATVAAVADVVVTVRSEGMWVH